MGIRGLSSSSLLGQTVPPELRSVEFRSVETPGELEAALRLVCEEYVRRGYRSSKPSRIRPSIYQSLPTTTTFIAIDQSSEVLGTVTLIQDSPLGLPMDQAYKPQIDLLRRQGEELAELSMFATTSRLASAQPLLRLTMAMHLFKCMFDYARYWTPTTELVACFHPRHERLYEFLHLQPLGGRTSYANANGKEAVARHLNIPNSQLLTASSAVAQFFYQEPVDAFEPVALPASLPVSSITC